MIRRIASRGKVTRNETCILLVFTLTILAAGPATAESYPQVTATVWPAGFSWESVTVSSPTFPLEAEITRGSGANTAFSRATPGRLHTRSACGTGDVWGMSRATARFIENIYPVRAGLPDNAHGNFIVNFVLSGSMRIHTEHSSSNASLSVEATSMHHDDPTGYLAFSKLSGPHGGATLFGLGAEVGGDAYPYNNIFANPDGSMRIYQVVTSAQGGYYTVTFQMPVQIVVHNFIFNQQPPANDWGSRVHVEVGAYAAYATITDLSATFELAAQNPILPDPHDPRVPHDGWSFTSSSGEIELPPPLQVATATGTGPVVFHASEGEIVSLAALDGSSLPSEGMPDDASHGFFDLTITGLEPGASTVLTVILPANLPPDTHWWYHVPESGWSHLECAGEDGDHVLSLILQDNGPADRDPTDGVIELVGGPSADEVPPAVFLSAFTAHWRDRGVDLAWRALGALTADFAVEAQAGQDVWSVPVLATDGSQFTARDEHSSLQLGGRVTYDLHHDGVLLASRVVALGTPAAPAELVLVAPNPFNPQTQITFAVTVAQRVRIAIHDLAGRRVATVADGLFAPGLHQAVWDGRDTAGRALPSGSYLVRLEGAQRVDARLVSLVR
jgi:hypothetical protein